NRCPVVALGAMSRTTFVVNGVGSAIGVQVAPRSVDCCSSYAFTAPPLPAVPDQDSVTGTVVAVSVEWLTMLGAGAVDTGRAGGVGGAPKTMNASTSVRVPVAAAFLVASTVSAMVWVPGASACTCITRRVSEPGL